MPSVGFHYFSLQSLDLSYFLFLWQGFVLQVVKLVRVKQSQFTSEEMS